MSQPLTVGAAVKPAVGFMVIWSSSHSYVESMSPSAAPRLMGDDNGTTCVLLSALASGWNVAVASSAWVVAVRTSKTTDASPGMVVLYEKYSQKGPLPSYALQSAWYCST